MQFATQVPLSKEVTIFISDNGSDKSTLLETIALKLNLPFIDGFIRSNAGFEAAHLLQSFIKIEFQRQTQTIFLNDCF